MTKKLNQIKLFDSAYGTHSISSQPITIDAHCNDEECLAWAKKFQYSFILLKDERGIITQYMDPAEQQPVRRAVHPGYLLSASSGLFEVFDSIKDNGFVLLLEGRETNEIITWQDLNRPPFYAWIFSQLALMEIKLKNCIRLFEHSKYLAENRMQEICSSIFEVLPEERFQKTVTRFKELQKEQAESDFIDALDLTDILAICLRQKALKAFLFNDFSNKEQTKLVGRITHLRNAIAHNRNLIASRSDCEKQFNRLLLVRNIISKLDQLDALMEAYTGTLYHSFEGLQIEIDKIPSLHGRPVQVKGGFLTAFNPWSTPLSEEENTKRHLTLVEHCQTNHWTYQEGEGQDRNKIWPAERSLWIEHISFTQAYALAKAFDQLAFVWVDHDAASLHWVL